MTPLARLVAAAPTRLWLLAADFALGVLIALGSPAGRPAAGPVSSSSAARG